MANIPKTSVTLLKDISDNATSVRWTEFHNKYAESMRAFMRSNYPNIEAEDVLQEAFAALVNCLPRYQYVPDEHGHFRNYLLGIVKHKAEDVCRRQAREKKLKADIAEDGTIRPASFPQPANHAEDETWRKSVMEAALDQLLADDSISAAKREVFRHVVLNHEKPADVARAFGITRNNVDQIKARLLTRLKGLVRNMSAARG